MIHCVRKLICSSPLSHYKNICKLVSFPWWHWKKLKMHVGWEIYVFMYPLRALIWPISFLMKFYVNAFTLDYSSHIFSSYNLSIVIFQIMVNKYNKAFNKKDVYLKLRKYRAKFVWLFVSMNAQYFQLKALKGTLIQIWKPAIIFVFIWK